MMPENFRVIITDTSCFSLLYKLDALEILNQLFSSVVTTPEIVTEFRFPLPDWVVVQAVNNKSLQKEYLEFVDLGEASAITLAAEISHNFLILDDQNARKFAEKLGLAVKGTIGLLVIAKNRGFIPLLKPYFDQIQQTNFRISANLLERVLRDSGE
jgi:predicted nucleic acid-binding protein